MVVAVRLGERKGHSVVGEEDDAGTIAKAGALQFCEDSADDVVGAADRREVLGDLEANLGTIRQELWNGNIFGAKEARRRGEHLPFPSPRLAVEVMERPMGIVGVHHEEEWLAGRLARLEELAGELGVASGIATESELVLVVGHVPLELALRRGVPDFPENAGAASLIAKDLHQRRKLAVRRKVLKPFDARAVRVPPGHDDASARLADGDIDVSSLEAHAVGCETVDVGSRVRKRAAEGPHRVAIHVVDGEHQDVRSLRLAGERRRRDAEKSDARDDTRRRKESSCEEWSGASSGASSGESSGESWQDRFRRAPKENRRSGSRTSRVRRHARSSMGFVGVRDGSRGTNLRSKAYHDSGVRRRGRGYEKSDGGARKAAPR